MDRQTLYYLLRDLIPQAVAIVAVCGLMLITWCASRTVTIHHYLKHHMGRMVSEERIAEFGRPVDALEQQTEGLF